MDDTGTGRGEVMGLQNSVGFAFVWVFFYQSLAVAVKDFPASTFSVLQIFLVLIAFL